MKRTLLAVFVCLPLLSGMANADDSDATKNCIAAWTTACTKDCATAKCVSNCTTQARVMCAQDLSKPQVVFSGPVVATATACGTERQVAACSPVTADVGAVPASCSVVSGTVADPRFWGGGVTIYVICPPAAPAGHSNEIPTTTVIGSAISDAANGKFSMTVSNACAGTTGCYGLIAVTPPVCSACPSAGDPGWSTCTAAACPNP